jgi:cephalosporin-C deacetylase-like acetyl esterase/lysophospholipase L1-like esterase
MSITLHPSRSRRVLQAYLLAALCCNAASAQQGLTFTPFHPNGIYQPGEKVGWTVTRSDSATGPARFDYEIKKNEREVLRSATLDLSSGTATIAAVLDEPCMVFVELRPEGASWASGGPQRRPFASVGAAVAPERIRTSVPRPADFDDFWSSKLKAMREISMDPVLTPMTSNDPGVEVSAVKVTALNSHMQGYLAKPHREGKFPALVSYQGAGVRALRPAASIAHAAEGWLVLDVDSHDKAPDVPTGPPSNYQTIGNTDREQSYFLNMYLRDTRAIDYIASRPDWDGKTIVILATSMGGQQGVATAALNPDRITALLVNEPSGGDTNGELHGRSAAYPNWPAKDPNAMQAALYFDTVNFASRVKAPSLVSMGFVDTVVPPVGVWMALNQIPAPKEALPMIEASHVHITPDKVRAFPQRSNEVLALLLTGAEYKPNQELTGGERQNPQSTPAAQPRAAAPGRAAVSPERQEAARKAKEDQLRNDWAEMKRYRDDDAKIGPPAKGETRVVFMGDSITDGWIRRAPEFFQGKPFFDRGISGQTSPQMLVRFHQDVVNLHPKVVVILAGTNDIAGNTGPATPEMIQDNFVSMVEIARANGIRVVLSSITPSDDFWWNPGTKPAGRIADMNTWIKAYAEIHGLVYLDYYSAMVDDHGGMKRELTGDGVHPNPAGYALMGKLAEEAIAASLASKPGK